MPIKNIARAAVHEIPAASLDAFVQLVQDRAQVAGDCGSGCGAGCCGSHCRASAFGLSVDLPGYLDIKKNDWHDAARDPDALRKAIGSELASVTTKFKP